MAEKECEICHRLLLPRNYKRHSEIHNPNRRRPHGCTYSDCERKFARLHNLKVHLQTHDPDRVKPYKCLYTRYKREFVKSTNL